MSENLMWQVLRKRFWELKAPSSKKKVSSPSPSVAAAVPEEQFEEQGGPDQDRVIAENVTRMQHFTLCATCF